MSNPHQDSKMAADADKYIRTMHNVALACVITCPLVMLLPPRKLGFSTIMLGGMTAYSANHLVHERTGKSLLQTITPEFRQPGQQVQIWSVQEKERQGAVSEGIAKSVAAQDRPDAWKNKRDEEVQEALDEGKGIGDMIYDQIWEVVNWGKKTEGDDN